MTERALNSYGREPFLLFVEESRDADDCIRAQQRERYGRIVEIHFAFAERANHVTWQIVDVDLQPYRECSPRAYTTADATVGCACQRFVQAQRAAPEVFVSKRGI